MRLISKLCAAALGGDRDFQQKNFATHLLRECNEIKSLISGLRNVRQGCRSGWPPKVVIRLALMV
jgi:hypothetical protein